MADGPASSADHAPVRDRRPPRLGLPRRISASGGMVGFRLGPAGDDLTGTLRLAAAGHTARASFRIAAGATTRVHIVLPRAVRAALRRHGRLRARVTLRLVDAAGQAYAQRFRVVLT